LHENIPKEQDALILLDYAKSSIPETCSSDANPYPQPLPLVIEPAGKIFLSTRMIQVNKITLS